MLNSLNYVSIVCRCYSVLFFFSSRRRHTRLQGDWSSDVCSSDLGLLLCECPVRTYRECGTVTTCSRLNNVAAAPSLPLGVESTVKTSEEERWHMRKAIHLMIAAAVAGLAAACGEGTAPASGQADVLAAEADQLGAMVDTDFGAAGAAATAAPTTSSSGVLAAPTATAGDTAPPVWGPA